MSKKEFKEINFSVRPLQTNFAAVLDPRGAFIAQSGTGAGRSVPELTRLINNIDSILAKNNQSLEGMKGLNLDPARAERILDTNARLSDARKNLARNLQIAKIQQNPEAMAKLASVQGAFNANVARLKAAGIPEPAGGWTMRNVAERMRALNLTPIRANAGISQVATPIATQAVTGNAFDRAMRKVGGVAKRHPVIAALGGLAAIGGAVKIARARDDGRIDPDSYYIMDNNSLSMVPRAFPSREAAMYMRDERYPGCAVNKGTTILQKA